MTKLKYVKGIKSISNLRDLGGKAVCGGVIKSGLLLRSAQPGNMSKRDRKKFDELNIKYVFDFRSDSEVAACPDSYVGNASYRHIAALSDSAASQYAYNDYKRFLKGITKEIAEDIAKSFVEAYAEMPFANKAYQAVFDSMDEGEPILFHCVGGKDRTGVMATLILLALGADRETIKEDYLLTNAYRIGLNRRNLLLTSVFIRNKNAEKVIKTVAYAYVNYIENTFRAIDAKYSDIKDFLLDEYGVTEERLKKWKQIYVE